MPLYSDLGYYLPSSSSAYSNRSPLSSLPYSPFSRLNPYTPPPPRPTIYGKDVHPFKPMLTAISESPLQGLRPGLTSLTRMNSGGKHYGFLRPTGAYVSPRPIRINAADIDVSASKFRRNRHARVRSTSPEPLQKQLSIDKKSDETTDGTDFMPRIDQNDPSHGRSIIKRDRNIVRLSIMRQRSQTHSNRSSSRGSSEKDDDSRSSNKIRRQLSNENKIVDDDQSKDRQSVKKSWRDRFGDSLQMNTQKVARKTPGELILERHIIREKSNTLKIPCEPTPTSTVVRLPDNITPHEITYLEPLIRKSIRRQSLINCPSFKDICEDISSDIKAEDDLNAGDLRRRASLILEQEAHILAQLTTVRRPSADVTVDEAIMEEPSTPDANADPTDFEPDKVEEKPSGKTGVENVIVIKKKTKKRGGKLKHKITVTVEVDNPLKVSSFEALDATAGISNENLDTTKSSPTWRAVVEEINEDVTVNLPIKIAKGAITATSKTPTTTTTTKQQQSAESNDEDFWHLIGRRESTYFKRKVDLKRNEIELIEIIDDNYDKMELMDKGSDSTDKNETKSTSLHQKDQRIAKMASKSESKASMSNSSSDDTNGKAGNSMWKENVKNDKNSTNESKKIAPKPAIKEKSIKVQPCENVEISNNKETNTIQMEQKPLESGDEQQQQQQQLATESTICPTNVENITTANKIETACYNYKQTDTSNVKAPTMMQTSKNLKIDTGLPAKNAETEPSKQKQKQVELTAASTGSTPITPLSMMPMPVLVSVLVPVPVPDINKVNEKLDDTTKMVTSFTANNTIANDKEKTTTLDDTKPTDSEIAKNPKKLKAASESSNDSIENADEKQTTKKVTLKLTKTKKKKTTATESNGNVAPKKILKKVKKSPKTDANGEKIVKLKSVSPIESEINADSTDADNSTTFESMNAIKMCKKLAATKTTNILSDHGNDNESEPNVNVSVEANNKISDSNSNNTIQFNRIDHEQNEQNVHDENDANVSSPNETERNVCGLSKFVTVANLSTDLSSIENQTIVNQSNERTKRSEQTTFSKRSIADSCISGDESIDFHLNSVDQSDPYSSSELDSESEDEMGQKRRHKKRKDKLDGRKGVKLDPKRKCYVLDQAPKYPLIATPRPLAKRSNYCGGNYVESESDSETSSDICSSDECYDECLSPNDIVVKDVIRMSTCSNDSGFEGGGTAPSSPKKMLETSYTYAQFQRSGTITAPATTIPRFKKYSVDDFHFLTVLGKGSFGKVLLAELKNTEYYYAVKCLKKDVVLEDDDVECTLIERKVLALGTKHPYLCHLFCTFQTESHLFFVMEYLNGGDLMFHIQVSGRFPEPRAKFYAAEIISGLKFLHKKGIIYRDLKLDNILLDFDGHVRIADFGMCKLQIYLDRTADSFCGTPDYMAPEIIKGQKYNQHVDWWSFGVLLYEMLIGQSPFSGCDEDELFWSVCNEIPWYPFYLSKEALNILSKLLEKDSSVRLGASTSPHGEIQDNIFFYEIDWKQLERRQLEPPFKPKIKHPLDTQYFDKTFTRERVRLTPIDKDILQSIDQHQFQGFTYTNPNTTPP